MRKATSISYLIEFIPILSVQILTSLYWPLQQKNKIGWIPLIFRINNASQTWGVLQVFTVRHTAAPPISVHDRSVMDHRTTESVSPPWGRTHGTHWAGVHRHRSEIIHTCNSQSTKESTLSITHNQWTDLCQVCFHFRHALCLALWNV